MLTYLTCFDISDDKIRRDVSTTLERYGTRVQYSVFEISFRHEGELAELKERLRNIINDDPDTDVRFYYQCRTCRDKSVDLNDQPIAEFPAAVII